MEIPMTVSVKSIADIAKIAGVAKSTVSRALNDSPLISQKTKAKIRAIADANNFEANHGARNLSLQQTNTIALLLPGVMEIGCSYTNANPFFHGLLTGIMDALNELDYDFLIGRIGENDPKVVQKYIASKRVDGAIVFSYPVFLDRIRDLMGSDIPLVAFGPYHGKSPFSSVSSDDYDGGKQATTFMLKRGRRRVAFLGGWQGAPELPLRYQGYVDAIESFGLEVDPMLVTRTDYSEKSGYEQMNFLLNQSPDIDGVFANSDVLGMAAIQALKEKGRRVPNDVAVVGFDDILEAQYSKPPLTTIRQNMDEVGKMFVQHLLQFIETGVHSCSTIPVELVERESA